MKRIISIIITTITISVFIAMQSPTQQKINRILWVGSSSTYNHEMPLQVADWLNRYHELDSVQAFMVGRSGTGFHDYLFADFQAQYGLKENQTLIDKILDEKYDYVVLQQIAYFMNAEDSLEIMQANATLCNLIRRAGGEPVFFEMGWNNDTLNMIGRQLIRREAEKNRVKYYVPCSEAWARVREERPDIELFNLPDRSHPGTYGAYLNFCCFYLALTGQLPDPLPKTIDTWPQFGKYDKSYAREQLKTTKQRYFIEPLPEFMRMMSVLKEEKTIPDDIARYLASVAWETAK